MSKPQSRKAKLTRMISVPVDETLVQGLKGVANKDDCSVAHAGRKLWREALDARKQQGRAR